MSKKSKLSLYRFVGILLLGVIVSRLFFLESFLRSFLQDDNVAKSKDGKHKPEVTISENRAFGDVTHDTWQQWLAEHDADSNHTKLNILKGKGNTGTGCGVSFQLYFESQIWQQSSIPSTSNTKAFFQDRAHQTVEHRCRVAFAGNQSILFGSDPAN